MACCGQGNKKSKKAHKVAQAVAPPLPVSNKGAALKLAQQVNQQAAQRLASRNPHLVQNQAM